MAFLRAVARQLGIKDVRERVSELIGTLSDVDQVYDERFFERSMAQEAPSAAAVAEILVEEFRPGNLVDVGCGIGIYLRAFEKLGVDVYGYDGSRNAIDHNLVDRDKLARVNLRRVHDFKREWDVCICFEVAEHLREKYGRRLVETLTKASERIVFTAARPGQGGTHHYNEQPASYWVEIFRTFGYELQEDLRDRLKARMLEKDVVPWVATNLMVFFRKPSA